RSPVRVRPLLPRRGRAQASRVGPRARHRAPDRGSVGRARGGRERSRRRGAAARELRPEPEAGPRAGALATSRPDGPSPALRHRLPARGRFGGHPESSSNRRGRAMPQLSVSGWVYGGEGVRRSPIRSCFDTEVGMKFHARITLLALLASALVGLVALTPSAFGAGFGVEKFFAANCKVEGCGGVVVAI